MPCALRLHRPPHPLGGERHLQRLDAERCERIELDAPQVLLDSVVGVTPGGLRTRTAVALDRVAMAEQLESDNAKTFLAVLAGVGVALTALFAVAAVSYCSSGWS